MQHETFQSDGSQPPHEITTQIRLTLAQGLTTIVTNEQELERLCTQFQINSNKLTSWQQQNNPEFQQGIESLLSSQYMEMITQKDILLNNLRAFVAHYEIVLHQVINVELKTWSKAQALGGNGEPYKDNLDEIQAWMEGLFEILTASHTVLNKMSGYWEQCFTDKPLLDTITQKVLSLQQDLITSSFIVEKQPPQVMKTMTRFTTKVRWLIGPQLTASASNVQVECAILSEQQAQRYYCQRPISNVPPESSGDISNNSNAMEYNPDTRHFTANFRNMQLRKIKRAEKKGQESVMDEKFALLFHTTTSFGEYRIRTWTLSLPVVVIVHGSQEPQSWATITWDNAFAEITREPFQVPDYVVWSKLCAALNTKFYSQTKRELTIYNMRFLCEKIFGNEIQPDDTKNYVKWEQFCKKPLPGRTFTFWEWFYAIMKLTKDFLAGPWQSGCIVGFINKDESMNQLRQCPHGTFLLRFSDSELGAITIAGVSVAETVNIFNLQPWTAKDLHVRSLADRISDFQHLIYLYPNIPKDEAFGGFYSPTPEDEQRTSNGYVKTIIKAATPGYPDTGSMSQPNTPQHNMQSPSYPVDMNIDMPGSNIGTYDGFDTTDFDHDQLFGFSISNNPFPDQINNIN